MDGTTYPRMNRVFLTGIAQEQPELRYTPSGVMVCSFRVQVGRILRDRSGGSREVAAYLTVVAWQEAAQRVSRELRKGQAIYVEGYVSSRSFTTARGDKRTAVEIYAEQIQILGPFEAEETESRESGAKPAPRPERPRRPQKQEKPERDEKPAEARPESGETEKNRPEGAIPARPEPSAPAEPKPEEKEQPKPASPTPGEGDGDGDAGGSKTEAGAAPPEKAEGETAESENGKRSQDPERE
ncbi:MAG: single-stranded DNA-binding protein [Candidatus Eisenbacteria bacterium]|nr:single-stranded DNA-binding protein [Candidatus Latescibacterota bacterium]MBD3302734.1 single-stranded DNA-binding protein [Candidatus Eisenbacteria bacterium]